MAQHEDTEAKARAKRQQRRERLFEQNVNDAMDALLKTKNGRDFLWWLLDIGKQGQHGFTGNALTTAFNCGEMNIGQQVFARMLEVNPDGYILMLKERQDAERTDLGRSPDASGNAPDGADSTRQYADYTPGSADDDGS